jgi:hypothetical protein
MGLRFLTASAGVLVAVLALLTGCGSGVPQGQKAPITVPAVPGAPIVAYLKSFQSGVGAIVALSGERFVELFPGSADVLLRRDSQRDTFLVLDRSNGVIYRHSLESTRLTRPWYRDRGANFQDVHALDDGTYWVSALNRESVVRLDADGTVRQTVSLAALAAPEARGLAYPTYFWTSGGRTFLLVQRLRDGVRPSDASYVVELDREKGLVGEPRRLEKTNPFTDWVPSGEGCALVGEAGDTGIFSKLDGAIERFCPAAPQPWSVIALETELERDIYDFVPLDEERLVCLSTSPTNDVFLFDSKAKRAEPPIATTSAFRFVDLEQARDGAIYVADRDVTRPGVRQIDVAAGTLGPVIGTALEPLSLLALP